MSEKIPKELRDKIEEGDITIEVKETPIGKEPVGSDNTSGKYNIDNFDQLREILDKKREIILKMYNIKQEHDGIDEYWHLAEFIEEHSEDSDMSNKDFSVLANVGNSAEGTYVGQMRGIHRVFPDKGYNEECFSPSVLAELTQIGDLSDTEVREINERASEKGISVTVDVMRAIRYVKRSSTLSETVNECLDKELFGIRMNTGEVCDAIYKAYSVLGNEIDRQTVEDEVKKQKAS